MKNIGGKWLTINLWRFVDSHMLIQVQSSVVWTLDQVPYFALQELCWRKFGRVMPGVVDICNVYCIGYVVG